MGTEVKRIPGLTDPVVVRTEVTPEKQLKAWVEGVPLCPNSVGNCCPDFSCCQPSLMWPLEKRRAFRDSTESQRARMLQGSLRDGAALAKRIEAAGGEPGLVKPRGGA